MLVRCQRCFFAVLSASLLLFAAAPAKAVDPLRSLDIPNDPLAGMIQDGSHKDSARVRIGLLLTPYRHVQVRAKDGTTKMIQVPDRTLAHTLRARIERPNHFYFGEWHVETVPLRWVQRTKQYQVRLNLYRRYGDDGSVEEGMGSIDVGGVLNKQDERLYLLYGLARKTLRDKAQQPVVDIVAGFRPEPQRNGLTASRDQGKTAPGAKVPDNHADHVRKKLNSLRNLHF